MSNYIYRREDNGETVEVGFAEMMEQKDGSITLPDGVLARRCIYLENHEQSASGKQLPLKAEIVSDALGVTGHQVAEFREDAAKGGFAVEFTTDPHEPTFYQARFNSWEEKARYMKHRGQRDRNSRNGGGQPLSPDMLRRAAARVREQSIA